MSCIIKQKEVITRKEQKCFGCARIFPSKTKMLREIVKDDAVFTVYLCSTCQQLVYERSGEEFGQGDLYELAIEEEQIMRKAASSNELL